MKIGLCTALDNLELAEKLGFDYIECSVAGIAALSDEEFENAQRRVLAGTISVQRANVLFPGDIKLIGPEKDLSKIDAYLAKALLRIKVLGAEILVFGSGKARAFPDNMTFTKAYRELVEITKHIGKTAASFGLTIAIEPLNRSETNSINSVIEGAMLEADANCENVGLLADLYHILKDNESLDNILAVKSLKHTHIAQLEGRAFPVTASKGIKEFIDALKKIGYTGSMSIEGNTDNLEEDARKSLALLRSFC